MPYIETHDHQSLYVRTLGKGPMVLLVHGFGMDSRHWLPIITPLLGRYRFVMPDLRGFGRSSRLTCSESCVLTSHSRDLESILAHYGHPPVYLAGISLGALTALQFLHRTGGRHVRHYLHIDQAPCVLNGPDWQWGLFGAEGPLRLQRWYALLEEFRHFSPETSFESLPQTYQSYFYEEFARFAATAMSKDWLKQGAHRLLRTPALAHQFLPMESWYTLLQHVNAYLNLNYDLRPLLPQVETPSTIMVGRRSEMYPWQGQVAMQRAMPDARLVMMERSGHVPFVDQPLRFIRILREIFSPSTDG
ncbi:alpha/beta hydrolase [Marinobacteraceae bacterium S3BR75-40.1]